MDDLTILLRTASDDAPPTSIDLDALISTEARRRRTRWAVAGAAVAVIATAGLSMTLTPPGRPQTYTTSGPTTTTPSTAAAPCAHASLPSYLPDQKLPPSAEAPDVAVPRLNAALPGLLPAGAQPFHPQRCSRVEFFYEPKSAAYRTTARVGRGQQEYSLAIGVSTTAPGSVAGCLNGEGDDCARTEVPGGSVAMADLVRLHTSATDWQRSVTVFRPDGTTVLVVVIGRHDALPSAEQLTAIGAAPAMTLHP